jgi:hypothetical protein
MRERGAAPTDCGGEPAALGDLECLVRAAAHLLRPPHLHALLPANSRANGRKVNQPRLRAGVRAQRRPETITRNDQPQRSLISLHGR